MKHSQETDFSNRRKTELLAPGLVTGGERLQANAGNHIPDIIFGLCNGKVKPFLWRGEKNYSGAKQEINRNGEQKTAKCVCV
jgi:hypothetical protein